MERDRYDLLSPEALANPYPVYERLRREAPVHWSEAMQVWILTRYDDVVAGFRDPRLSSDRIEAFASHQLRGLDPSVVADQMRVTNRMMVMKDVPHHARMRRMVSESFTRQALNGWRPIIREVANDLIDRVQAAGRMDLVADFSQPLPARIIAEMFGIAAEDREHFQEWSDDIMKFFGGSFGDIEADARRANTGIVNLERHFMNMIAARRRIPGRDLMSHLIAHQEHGELDAEELTAQCILLLVAGHTTTIEQISNGVHALLTHPEQLRNLRREPALMDSAVQEILRFAPAAPFIHRLAKEDVEMGGRRIAKGQVVFLGLASANHDPAHFPEPERFDITRRPNKQIAFGVGPHTCVGAELARLELVIGLEALLERLPDLRLGDEPPELRCESLTFRGFRSMPVWF